MKVWDASTGKEVLTLRAREQKGDSAMFNAVDTLSTLIAEETNDLFDKSTNSTAISPDGTRILSGSADGMLKLWETETDRDP